MAPYSKKLAGPGYVVLSILRVMTIISLIMVIIASWVMLVKTFVISKFFLFDAVSHLVTCCVGLFLIISELQFFKSYFYRNWPLLGPESGLVTLGVTMIVLGVSILGNMNKQATSQASLGLPYWRIVISTGILVAILGILNVIASFVFRDRDDGITARMVRSKGAVAGQKPALVTSSSTYSSPRLYHQPSTRTERQASVRSNRTASGVGPRLPINISAPLNHNSQFDGYHTNPSISMPVIPGEVHHPNYWEKV